MKDNLKKVLFFIIIIFTFIVIPKQVVHAQSDVDDFVMPKIDFSIGDTKEDNPKAVTSSLQLLFLLTIISLAPSILIMMTAFVRIIIGLHFLRSALGTQQMPPNQVLVGLALFLTLFVMGPTFTQIDKNAIKPYSNGEIGQEKAIEYAMKPLREFMFAQVEDKDIALFLEMADETFTAKEQVSTRVLIPAFIVGEITKGFKFGVIIYIPFIVIDMVVSSILMAMGMMMLPPAMISLPFKILIFILAGGWNLVIESLVRTFRFI